jgi:hypothetical protein
MKISHPRQPRGSILVFALLCSAVAVLGMTYWIATVAGRGNYVATLHDGAKRRMARENARIIATRYAQARVLPDSAGDMFSRGLGSYYAATDNYEWGGTELTAAWNGSVLSSVTPSIGINRISYADTAGFGLRTNDENQTGFDLPMLLMDGSQKRSYRWQARSYSPALAGDLFVVYRPPAGAPEVDISGSIAVHGRAYFWMGASGPTIASSVTFDTYATSGSALASMVATDFVPSNYPPIYNLSSTSTSGPATAGYSNVVWDPNSPGYSLRNKALDEQPMPALYMVNGATVSTSSNGYSSDGLGTVSIDLSSPTLEFVVVENASTLRLTGQTTATTWADVASYPSVLIVYHQAAGSTYNLTTIQMAEKNNRRLVLGVKKDENLAAVTIDFPDAATAKAGVGPEWRMIAHLESTPATITYTGSTLNLTGGLATDRSLSAPSDSGRILHIYREAVPLGLTSKTPRRAWVEGFKQDD